MLNNCLWILKNFSIETQFYDNGFQDKLDRTRVTYVVWGSVKEFQFKLHLPKYRRFKKTENVNLQKLLFGAKSSVEVPEIPKNKFLRFHFIFFCKLLPEQKYALSCNSFS